MKKIGIIDIGSNSVRLVIAQIHNDNSFRIVTELKEIVRLAQGLEKELKLQPDRMEKAIHTLKVYKDACHTAGTTEIIAVATEAVRKATNKEEFLKRVVEEVGIEIRILSGQEEAYYDYFAVVNSMDLRNGLIMDIGGSSTELIWIKDRKRIESISLPFGAINLTHQFGLSNRIEEEKEKHLKQFLLDFYKQVPWLEKLKGQPLIGIGGTIRNIGKIDRKGKNYPLDITHNYQIKNTDLFEIYESARSKTLSQRKKIKGLSDDRADIFVGATAAVSMLAEYCEIQDIFISGHGVREGLIYSYLRPEESMVENILDFSINNLLLNHDVNTFNSSHVYYLLQSLYEQLKPIHTINEDMSKILKTSSMLHSLGISIRYYDYHKHSFYMILNSEINGLTHRELLMSACVVASHRKNLSKVDAVHYKVLLSNEDMENIQNLGLLLRIATCLNARMNGNVEKIHCSFKDEQVFIKTLAKNNPSFEINQAMECASSFKKLFKKELIIV